MFEGPPVIVLCNEDRVDPGIARSLLRNRWRLIDGRSGPPAIKSVMLARARAVIVQVPAASLAGNALRMIQRLAQHWNPVRVLAIAGPDAGDVEMMVRHAGADCFLPHPSSPEVIEAALESLVPGVMREGSPRPDGAFERATGTTGPTGRVSEKPGASSRRSRRTH